MTVSALRTSCIIRVRVRYTRVAYQKTHYSPYVGGVPMYWVPSVAYPASRS